MFKVLEELHAEILGGEASGVFTTGGRALAWHASPPEMARDQQSSLIPAVISLAESARLAGLPPLEQIFIEGSERKILLVRIRQADSYLALMGGKSMNAGPALGKLRQAAAAWEGSFKESK
ncbi:MAG: hypothetical protein A2Y86_02430 [Candidatus Aminicenantes bacterium RBG_13_62_12]|nr:MAG: hypothetical protein A2Y86_02430 [Candidatus Aminicenantes bacterium RBG_13_62_12]